ncbi:hypothetical protein QT972_11340 [Microcoleus sp. herbarium7]|uniref:hypothetical protein n=1 Tax=Microcoleus sp. herbarium7 TaxID=3055435 RepID=UPI002FCF3C69
MAITPNRKRKPSCHHNLADKPDQETPKPKAISKLIFISLVLGGIATLAIFRGFDGLIEIKLGLEGGQVLIDGRKAPSYPPIMDNSSNTK